MNVDVLTPTGTTSGSVELPDSLFDVQVNVPLIHQVVVAQLAAARQGTHDTKTRGEVRGGGRKPYKQKGTGRARQGSTRAPQFTGGGVVHGPTPRDYAQRTPKKMKAAALRGALSDRARNGRVHVISAVVAGDVPSSKSAASVLATVSERRHLLVVLGRADIVGWKSLRNLANVHPIVVDQLNTYDVLCSDDVVFTEEALAAFVAASPIASEAGTGERGTGTESPAVAASADEGVGARIKLATAKAAAIVEHVSEEVAEEVIEIKDEVAEEVIEFKDDLVEKATEIKAEVAERVLRVSSARAAKGKTAPVESDEEVDQ